MDGLEPEPSIRKLYARHEVGRKVHLNGYRPAKRRQCSVVDPDDSNNRPSKYAVHVFRKLLLQLDRRNSRYAILLCGRPSQSKALEHVVLGATTHDRFRGLDTLQRNVYDWIKRHHGNRSPAQSSCFNFNPDDELMRMVESQTRIRIGLDAAQRRYVNRARYGNASAVGRHRGIIPRIFAAQRSSFLRRQRI
jgi:hypothetical protein